MRSTCRINIETVIDSEKKIDTVSRLGLHSLQLYDVSMSCDIIGKRIPQFLTLHPTDLINIPNITKLPRSY